MVQRALVRVTLCRLLGRFCRDDRNMWPEGSRCGSWLPSESEDLSDGHSRVCESEGRGDEVSFWLIR